MLHRFKVICCHLRVSVRDTGGANLDTKIFTVVNKAQTLETLKPVAFVSWIPGLRLILQMAVSGRKLWTESNRVSGSH